MAWISAEAAMRRLNVRQQTLYAYVSRGRLEARPDPADPRRSLYNAEQLERLARRKSGPRRAAEIAGASIAWGEPVLASALTTIIAERLYYRGHDAIALSEHATLEEAAALFWDAPPVAPGKLPAVPKGTQQQRLYHALASLAADSASTKGRAPAALTAEASRVLETVANAAAGSGATGAIHARLADAWGLNAKAARVMRRALVLLVDHELNASTFAARVAASTGASLAAAALAGLSTLSGPLHGASIYRVMKFVRECRELGEVAAVRGRLEEGRTLPGFGHPLYPSGDPRATALLADLPPSKSFAALRAAVEVETGERPNVDLAIAALASAYELPEEALFAIFAVGRCVGWLGHAIEQAQTGTLIRPRARYVGVAPVG